MFRSLFAAVSLFIFSSVAGWADAPYLLQHPSLSQSQIAFRYADDVWTVAREGGVAERLTSNGSLVAGPFFSPDGSQIAYSAVVNGNVDVYTVAAAGGEAHRVTWHPGGDRVVGWTPDGDLLFVSDRTSFNDFEKLFRVKTDGSGIPQEVPLPSVDEAAYSPDGKQIAYTPFNQWQKAWKRYRGGQTEPIWIVDMASLDLVKVPRENSNDHDPMWVGDTVYFLSDRNGPVTMFAYDTKTQKVEQAVENRGLDLKSANAGPGGIVYEQFGSIHLFDTAAKTEHAVQIALRGDLPKLLPHIEKIPAQAIESARISPTGARAVFEAHGEVFTVPAEKGDVRNLTNTANAAERDPSWSPDGKWIAYFSDASGEYQLYLREQSGITAPKVIDLGPSPSYFYAPVWSPDSKKIAFGDKRLNLWVVDVDGGKPMKVDTDEYEGFGPPGLNAGWSPDGKWIVYLKTLPTFLHAAYLYSFDTHKGTRITDGMSDVANPVFDASGKYLYFTATTDIGPSADGFNLSTLNRLVSRNAYVVVLAKDLPSPLKPESDDEKGKDDKDKKDGDTKDADSKKSDKDKDKKGEGKKDEDRKDGDKKDGDKKDEAKLPTVKIDLDGIDQRVLSLPVPARNYTNLLAGKEGVIYLGEGDPVAQSAANDGPPMLRSMWRFTLEKRQTDEVLKNIRDYAVSANGEKLLYSKGEGWFIADAGDLKPGGGDGPVGKPLNLGGMEAKVDPRAEWKQMYHETWRIERDFLYDPNHHGLDLKKIEAKYEPYLAGLGARSELNYLFEEMLGEITIGHMFVRGPGRHDDAPLTGLLGADYTVEQNRYKFAHILNGENWNPTAVAPLTQPGVNVKVGEYLLAVNGKEIHATDNLYSFFDGLAGQQTVLKVGPNADGRDSREVTVVPLDSEHGLRGLEWVEANRRKVDAMSGGKVAYVYMPNTTGAGFTSFNRYFFSQTDKKAVVVDERYNEGGQIADYVIDTLKRVPMSNYTTREGKDVTEPSGAIFGPKAMIINQSAGSGGDAMPWYFRKAGLGKLIGTKTWGGLVGIGGFPPLLDGGSVTAPRTALYGLTGQWEVENHGIAPDIEVEYLPKPVAAGHDPQLEQAVQTVLDELKEHPVPVFVKPPYPNYHANDGLGVH